MYVPQESYLNGLLGSKRNKRDKSTKLQITKSNFSTRPKSTILEKSGISKKPLHYRSISYQELLGFKYKSLEKKLDDVMNQMHIRTFKTAHTEDPISIESLFHMTSSSCNPYSSSLPSQNRYKTISVSKTGCYLFSK